jgi:CRISPR-associated Csx11 family protein
MTSADEKGVVRRKQSVRNMWISTPFGHQAQRIDLDDVEKLRNQMDEQLADAFQSYLSGKSGHQELHEQVIRILKPCLSITLGETRLPANDVTLWAQSHGVASLYKPVLAALAMGFDPCPRKHNSNDFDYNNIRWRLFGIGWNGLGFIQRGRKPSDILIRQEILSDISRDIQGLLEVRYPVGNRFYVDINGLFFTFPVLGDDEAAGLVKRLAPELVRIVRKRSQEEMWPFFTLSKPHRTLTIITKEMDVRDQIASVPKVSAFLSMDQDAGRRRELILADSPALPEPAKGQDICPVCQVRSKMVRQEACDTCENRRSGRQRNWQENRDDQTIWVDEVADKSNRIALLTLRFDLSRWLSGEWLTTQLSQTFSDWLSSERMERILGNQQQRQKLERIVSPVTPTKEAIMNILGHVGTRDATRDAGFKTAVLNTFFEDVKASEIRNEPNYIVTFLENLRGRINDSPGYQLTAEDLATAVFTQNPSPARLGRIWEETETFLATWLTGIKDETFAVRPERVGFTTTAAIPGVHEGQTYRILVPNLLPGPLVVLCLNKSAQDYLTVDSLEKFRFKQGDCCLSGLMAVQRALEENGIESWLNEATGKPLTGITSSTAVQRDEFRVEPYLPFIVLVRSSVYCQALLPADRIPDVLKLLLAHTGERFRFVKGKLPLHVGLLVSKRKFPLYALIGGGRQVLDNPSFQNGIPENPWWNTSDQANNPFYGQYPSSAPTEGGHDLANLWSGRRRKEVLADTRLL